MHSRCLKTHRIRPGSPEWDRSALTPSSLHLYDSSSLLFLDELLISTKYDTLLLHIVATSPMSFLSMSLANLAVLDGSWPTVAATSFISYLIYKRYEPPSEEVLTNGFLLVIVPTLLAYITHLGALRVWFAYITLILAFTAAYRLSPFHPLAAYPGPRIGHLTQLWLVWITYNGKQHLYYKQLHDQYGEVVRIGPNELSFRSVDAVNPIIGPSGLRKGPYWDGRQSKTKCAALIMQRDIAEHKRRRQTWNRAFGRKAMESYQSIVIDSARELLSAFEKRENEVVDLGLWMAYFAFDFMGLMAFGESFGLVKQGADPKGLWHMLESGTSFSAVVARIPWAGMALRLLPPVKREALELERFAEERVSERIEKGSPRLDIFHHLIDVDNTQPTKPSRAEVISDGLLAIIAGSDTTAMTLSAFFYFMLRDRERYTRLQAEIDATFPPGSGAEPTDVVKQANEMPYLNACINETLRLLPAVPSGVQREVPRGSGGKAIGQYFVPEHTQVFVHTYSLQRDSRYFSPFPESFWPERWLSPEMRATALGLSSPNSEENKVIHNTVAFIPFSAGPANCAGKPLALMELRAIFCFVLQKYHIESADEKVIQAWEGTLKDFLTTQWGALPVRLSARF